MNGSAIIGGVIGFLVGCAFFCASLHGGSEVTPPPFIFFIFIFTGGALGQGIGVVLQTLRKE